MAGGEDAARPGGTVGAACRDAFGGFSDTLPTDLLMAWERIRWCATFGWTFEEYDRQDVRAIGEATVIMEKAHNFRVPISFR